MEEKSPPIKAYLYSIKTGKLVVYEGFITPSSYNLRVRFFGKRKKVMCYSEPGEVFESSLWLPERDDNKARKLLIEFEEELVARYRERVQDHLSKIHTLKGVEIHEGQATSRKTRTNFS